MTAAAEKKTETKASEKPKDKVEDKAPDTGEADVPALSINDRLNKIWLELESEYERDATLVAILNDLTDLQIRIKELDD